MPWIYQGLVPILPLLRQACVTLWAVAAPHLCLSILLSFIWPASFYYVLVIAGLSILWRIVDPIGQQAWPAVKTPAWSGVFGGSDDVLGRRRQAIQKVAATYNPTPWLWSGDQRTVALAAPRTCQEKLEPFHIKGAKGDLVLQMRFVDDAPIVFALGGVGGDPDSPFLQDLNQATKERGWGFGTWVTRPDLLPADLSSAPDFTDTSDIHRCLQFIKQKCPRSALHLVGYSLGGCGVLLYTARHGDEALCDAAVAVAASFLPVPITSERYQRYWQPWLTASLKLQYYSSWAAQLPARDTIADASTYAQFISRLPHIGGLPKFMEKGFANGESKNIRRPLLFFAAADDPFHPIDKVGIDPSFQSVLYYITDSGGHLAWPEGWSADCSRFHTRVMMAFLETPSGNAN